MVLAAIHIQFLLPFALFGGVAAVVLIALEYMASGRPRAEERLNVLCELRRRKNGSLDNPKKEKTVARVLKQATPNFAKPLQPKDAEEEGKLRDRLNYAGFRSENAVSVLLGLKVIGLIVGLILGGGTSLFLSGITQRTLMVTISTGGILFYLPDLILKILTSRRQQAIFLGLPDALDLMVVCVEAGLGLDQAMRKVAEEMQKSYRIIADEFALCNLQLQMGRGRNQVLHELGTRTGVDDLRSLASILIQTDKFGSSIAQALRVQSDSMRTRRSQLAEEKAAMTAVKLVFPLVLFIFPGIFVVLVGPASITMIRQMLPMMAGG